MIGPGMVRGGKQFAAMAQKIKKVFGKPAERLQNLLIRADAFPGHSQWRGADGPPPTPVATGLVMV
jgi:hypothetical protein